MTLPPLPACFWLLFAAVAATYLLLAAWRTNVSLRPLRIGGIAVAAMLSRVILWSTLLIVSWEWLPIASSLIAVVIASWVQRIWLIHVDQVEFRQRLDEACRGLRLEARESPPGQLDLVERQHVQRLVVTAVSTAWVLIQLPRVARPSKVALLVDWLAKQYPGPVPRIHIHLSGER
jgi:hypothetical protein